LKNDILLIKYFKEISGAKLEMSTVFLNKSPRLIFSISMLCEKVSNFHESKQEKQSNYHLEHFIMIFPNF
jgi:vacuolar-type H+-ATPase subunit E/Vma4